MDGPQRRLIARRCSQIAGRQFGVITREQALAAGMTSRQVERMLKSSEWCRLLPSTYSVAAAAPSLQQHAMAATSWGGPDAAVSHETACALRRFANVRNRPIEISGSRNLRFGDVVVHVVRPWEMGEVELRDGIPMTSIERTLMDMADRELAPRLEELLDEAFRRSLTNPHRLHSYVQMSRGTGRHGAAALQRLLPRYMNGGAFSESILETRLRHLLEESGLPQPVAQYEVRNGGRFVARVDFAWPGLKVGVEAMGRSYHEGQWQRDLSRTNRLTECGWVVIYVTWEDLHMHPRETVMSIARALGITL